MPIWPPPPKKNPNKYQIYITPHKKSNIKYLGTPRSTPPPPPPYSLMDQLYLYIWYLILVGLLDLVGLHDLHLNIFEKIC